MHITIRMAARAIVLVVLLSASTIGASAVAQTPASGGCDTTATPETDMHDMDHGTMATGSPAVGMHHMDHGTPMSGMHDIEFDLMYIDMMIPHHESIIALAGVAQQELTHPELIEMAGSIVETQDAEIEEMERLRDAWYPDAAPVSMETMMGMPGMEGADMAMMDQVMSAAWQVQSFCSAEDKDLAFIEQTIPHHQMAIDVSEAALTHAVHPELVTIAEEVIAAQEAEIKMLESIRTELTGEATPQG